MEVPIATVGRWELKHTMCQQNNLLTIYISNLKTSVFMWVCPGAYFIRLHDGGGGHAHTCNVVKK